MFTSILIFTKRIRYYVFDFLKEVFHMPFFIPAVISAVTTAATESASMFVAGATSAYRIFHDWGGGGTMVYVYNPVSESPWF